MKTNGLVRVLMVLACGCAAWPAGAEPWKPAAGPLMTRWAKDVGPENAHPEYPRPQMVRRQWLNLNGLWQYAMAEPNETVPTGKELAGQILVPFPIESALSGVGRRTTRLWYRRTFEVPDDWKGQRVVLHFQAVDWEATVHVNGREIGTHRGGYDSFSFDVTAALKGTGPQELIVGVFDPSSSGDQPRGKQVDNPRGIWYTPSTGIWQTVWLEPVPEAQIRRLVLVPDVDGSCLRLEAACGGTGAGHAIEVVASDEGKEIGRASGSVADEIRLAIPKDRLKLWSPDEPFLYDLTVRLTAGGKTVDEVSSYFGMRKIERVKDEHGHPRMRLNGQFVFQIGPLDQGFWPDGLYTAPTDEALRYDIEVTKQLGFNMARKHVKIEPDRWYYWCDKLGLLVWQDMPSANNKTPESKKQFERELHRMVDGFRNHPSIVMWVVFNEGWGQHDTERYVELVNQWDATRLVNNASGWTDKETGDVLDIHRYPGPGAPPPQSDRVGVLGEFGGLKLGVDGHTWTDKTWGYRETASAAELTSRYQRLLRGVWGLRASQGLDAAVYTQTTDVETECNGLMTYDRAITKVDVEKTVAANQGRLPVFHPLVPTARTKPVVWRYALDRPAEDWFKESFDDSAWKEGEGGFGTKETPGATVGTVWNTQSIWIRRQVELPEIDAADDDLMLLVHHDEDVEIYINGVLAAKADKFTVDYEEMTIRAAARAAIRPGKNVLAVHCKQTMGGQYVDVGIGRLVAAQEGP
ncbi:MAG: glycoside hydrolase family 2 [Planctomycetes bacterium]|nr:glycoside hydrolase family 2 [Planctomycetota bacterium]